MATTHTAATEADRLGARGGPHGLLAALKERQQREPTAERTECDREVDVVGAARRPAAAAAAPGRSAHSRPMQCCLLRLADGLARCSMPQPTTCKRTGIEHDKSKLGWKSALGALARANLIDRDHVHDDWSHCGVLRASECSSPRICREALAATKFAAATAP